MTFRLVESFIILYDRYIMGILKNIFKTIELKEEKVLSWQALQAISELDEIVKRSLTKPQLIFKHSTRCGISKMVMNQFIDNYNLEADADLYYLDLLSYREVSNEVSAKFQVYHQSPQLLIIINGITVAHASHGAINDLELQKYLR